MRLPRRRLGIVGCGAIGSLVAKLLKERRSSFTVTALYDHHPLSAQRLKKALRPSPKVCRTLRELVRHCDLVLEAASQEAVPGVAQAALSKGRPVVLMSTGGFFLHRKKLTALAKEHRTKVYLPSGALAGLDGLKAARQRGPLSEVSITTVKPPKGLAGAPGLTPLQRRRLLNLKAPLVLYRGNVPGALKRFPANVNVAATLALASGSPAKVKVTVQADPGTKYNRHLVRVKGSFGVMEAVTKNLPSALNPKTSALAIQSALALFERLESFVEIGS